MVAVLSTATAVVAGSSGCSASTGKGSARFAKFQAAPKSQGLDVGYVAKIACANVANLLLARASGRLLRAYDIKSETRRFRRERTPQAPPQTKKASAK